MTNKSKKGKKSEKGDSKQTVNGQLQQGMSQASTPPSVIASVNGAFGNMSTLPHPNLQPSSLIRQSHELLYGNQLQMGVFPPSPTTTSSMPALINPTLQPVGCSQIQNMQTNVPNMPSSQPTQPILSTYSDSTGNYKQQMPQPQLYQQQHQYQQVQPPSQQSTGVPYPPISEYTPKFRHKARQD